MPVTLAQAKLSAADDIDVTAIDEFQKQSALLNAMLFDDVVNAAGAGGTLTYGYTRQITQATAGFRAINAEYTPQEVTKARYSTDLKPLGGSFQIDRVLDGVAAGAETAFQMRAKINGAQAAFNDAIINGDVAVDANGFDGLSKALVGSTTELGAAAGLDWTAIASGNDTAFAALDAVDELVSLLDGPPTALLANGRLAARLRGVARRAGIYTSDPVAGLLANDGGVRVDRFGNFLIIDMGTRAGTNDDVIPLRNTTVGGQAGTYTDLYAVRIGLDGFHAVSMAGRPVVQTWLPDFGSAGAVKTGEVELGPVSVALKATKAAAVRRNIRLA